MTREEAIKTLDAMWKMLTSAYDEIADSFVIAYSMAIDALKAQIDKDIDVPNNDDIISRQAAIELIERMKPYHQEADDIAEMIANMPSAQPERKNGEWTKDCACGICGFKPWYERDIHTLSFCPNCGADMRGKGEK